MWSVADIDVIHSYQLTAVSLTLLSNGFCEICETIPISGRRFRTLSFHSSHYPIFTFYCSLLIMAY